MAYNFKRYTDYMAKNGIDVVIASNYDIVARMLNNYFRDLKLIDLQCREWGRFAGCDRNGEMISIPDVIPNPVPFDPKAGTTIFEPRVVELARVLKENGLDRGVIGLEMLDFPTSGFLILQEAMPNATFVDATLVIRQDLAVKTPREIGYIEKAVEMCEASFRAVMANMRQSIGRPVSELMLRYFAPEINRLGGELIGSNLTSTPWDWYRKEDGTTERQEPLVTEGGTPINFDLLCGYQAAMCDIAFRGLPGEPDEKFVEVWETSVAVKDALERTVKPGMTAVEGQDACIAAMREAVGNAWDTQYWAVHSCGLHVHEFPQIGSPYHGQVGDYVFETGMVLSVESIAEQAFVLEENGLRRLGEMPMVIYKA